MDCFNVLARRDPPPESLQCQAQGSLVVKFSPRHFALGVLVAVLLGGAISLIFGVRWWWVTGIALLAMLVNGWIADRLDGDG